MFKKAEKKNKEVEKLENDAIADIKDENETTINAEDKSEELKSTNEEAKDFSDAKPIKPIHEKIEYVDEDLKQVESFRVEFYKFYKKTNIYKWIATGISMVGIVLAYLYLSSILWAMIALAIVCLGLMWAAGFVQKKVLDKEMINYFKRFNENVNKFTFSNPMFSSFEAKDGFKLPQEEFVKNNVYVDIAQVGSRNYVSTTTSKGVAFDIVDLAAQIKTAKRLKPVFVGKYIVADNTFKQEEPILIYFKSKDPAKALPPTNIANLPLASDDKKISIYTSDTKYKTHLKKEVQAILNKITTDDLLIDLTINITAGKTYILLGYDDPLMVLPLQNQFDPKPTKSFVNDLSLIVELVEALNVKKQVTAEETTASRE